MYRILWQYQVRAGEEATFEEFYRSEGTWAQFFRNGKGYRGTRLYRDAEKSLCYLTIDEWDTRANFEKFRTDSRSDYEEIDRQCEALTEVETFLGSVETK